MVEEVIQRNQLLVLITAGFGDVRVAHDLDADGTSVNVAATEPRCRVLYPCRIPAITSRGMPCDVYLWDVGIDGAVPVHDIMPTAIGTTGHCPCRSRMMQYHALDFPALSNRSHGLVRGVSSYHVHFVDPSFPVLRSFW